MSYTKQTWTDGDTTKPVSAARMQHIEDGLDAVANGGSIAAGMRPHRRAAKASTRTKVTIFESGHGWTTSGTLDSSNLNDTTDYVCGTQAAKIVTGGGGSGAAGNFGKLGMSNMDLSSSYLMVMLKVENVAHLSQLQMYVGSSSLANYYLCNILNTSAPSAISEGEWIPVLFDFNNAATVGTPSRSTITDLRFHAWDDGTAKVTIHFNGVWIIPKQTPFPNGVVTIWWDDVFLDAYNSGRPRMDLYGFPGVCCPIIGSIGNGTYLTLAQLKALQVNNGWQVVPHAYTQAAHDARLSNQADYGYSELYQSLDYLTKQGFEDLDDYAYPGGIWGSDVTPNVEAVARQFFRMARLTTAWPRQQFPQATPLRTGAIDGQNLSLANFQAEIDRAYTEGEWVHAVWHAADANLNAKIDYLNTKGIPVRTAADVMASF